MAAPAPFVVCTIIWKNHLAHAAWQAEQRGLRPLARGVRRELARVAGRVHARLA